MTTLNCPVCGSGEFGDCVCPPRTDEPCTEINCAAQMHPASEGHIEARGACTCMAGTPLVGPGVLHEIGCGA